MGKRIWISVLPLLWATPAFAQNPNIEVYQGPIMAEANVLAMGGAYIAAVEGAGAQQVNPAGVANRFAYERDRWYAWDFSFATLLVGTGGAKAVDVENNGRLATPTSNSNIIVGALGAAWGSLGLGFTVSTQTNNFCNEGQGNCPPGQVLTYEATTGGLTAGWAFLNGQLISGARLNIVGLQLKRDNEQFANFAGFGGVFGAVWQPHQYNYRAGITFTTKVRSSLRSQNIAALVTDGSCADPSSPTCAVQLPGGAEAPRQLGLGFAYRFSPFPYNRHWTVKNEGGENPEDDESDGLLGYRYYLVTADLVLVGRSSDAIGLESWIDPDSAGQPVGKSIGVSPRLGFETEFWPDRMRGRAGAYFEPARFAGVGGRVHGTFGVEVRLFRVWWHWKAALAVDLAKRYNNTVFSVGFWH